MRINKLPQRFARTPDDQRRFALYNEKPNRFIHSFAPVPFIRLAR